MEVKNKGKKILLVLFFAVLILGSFHLGSLYGSDRSPGGNLDPLITKSYLDERISKLSLPVTNLALVTLEKDKKLILSMGSFAMVYQGNGTVIGSSGLINTSKGNFFQEGDSLVKYNLFLAPFEDCGIISKDNMLLFVSGNYKIKK